MFDSTETVVAPSDVEWLPLGTAAPSLAPDVVVRGVGPLFKERGAFTAAVSVDVVVVAAATPGAATATFVASEMSCFLLDCCVSAGALRFFDAAGFGTESAFFFMSDGIFFLGDVFFIVVVEFFDGTVVGCMDVGIVVAINSADMGKEEEEEAGIDCCAVDAPVGASTVVGSAVCPVVVDRGGFFGCKCLFCNSLNAAKL